MSYIIQAVVGPDAIKVSVASFFDTVVLNIVLLPVIIFESGWSLNRRDFISQLGYIAIFAIFGTIISTVVVACLMLQSPHITGIRHPIAHARTALAYASLISAVDPVATLATYAHLNVSPLLNVLVFGESVINDAVAIALFRVLNSDAIMQPSEEGIQGAHLVWNVVVGVLVNFFGGIALAMVMGCFYIMVIRFSRMRSTPHFVILFIFMSCFFTYCFAESVCGLSGIITELFCAMILSAWVRPHLTMEGMMLASFFMKQIAALADMAVFMLIGVAVVTVTGSGLKWSAYIMFFCLIGRAFAVFPLGALSNAIKWMVGRRLPAETRHFITWRLLLMMWHAGLRGGIALVLCFELGDWVDDLDGPGTKDLLTEATFVLICVFLLVFGGSTQCCLKLLKIPMGSEVDPSELLYNADDKHGYCWRALYCVQERVLFHALVGNAVKDSLEMPGGVVAAVLREARHAERQPPATTIAQIRALATASAASESRRHQTLDLFGTTDPAHIEDLDDIRHIMSATSWSGRSGHGDAAVEQRNLPAGDDSSEESAVLDHRRRGTAGGEAELAEDDEEEDDESSDRCS